MSEFVSNDEIMFTQFTPMMKHSFIMQIDGIPAYTIKTVDRPKVTTAVTTIPHINSEFYVKGKTKWENVSLTLLEPIVPSGAQAIMEWLRLSHESLTGRDGYPQMYQRDITINVLGPVGDKVQEWTYKSAWPSAIDFGGMDMGNESDPTEINVTLVYNFAVLNY